MANVKGTKYKRRMTTLPSIDRDAIKAMKGLSGLPPEEAEQLLQLKALLVKHLLAKFADGRKITINEVAAAMTLLRKAGLIDLEPAEPPEVQPAPAEVPGGAATSGTGQTGAKASRETQQAPPGSIEAENASPGTPPAASARVTGWNGKRLELPFGLKGEDLRAKSGS